ncbi:hypothetical protein ACGFNV_09360 [Streptomyces sp. NPDC048751]|uniref:hypothetical protein n=1 Tax=Streptomyces sp. NPDC048751 TaxID=3365591 RepID=UPI003711B5AA
MMAKVLAALFTTDSGSLTSAELVRRLQVSPASVSKAVGYLDRGSLRGRSPEDRRHHPCRCPTGEHEPVPPPRHRRPGPLGRALAQGLLHPPSADTRNGLSGSRRPQVSPHRFRHA